MSIAGGAEDRWLEKDFEWWLQAISNAVDQPSLFAERCLARNLNRFRLVSGLHQKELS